jgi:DNA gyrase subunit A
MCGGKLRGRIPAMETDDPRWTAQMAAARLAILDAMSVAIDQREELIGLVGTAPDGDQAVRALQSRFGFDEIQAHAVLDLQVRRFSELERSRIADERESLRRTLGANTTDP